MKLAVIIAAASLALLATALPAATGDPAAAATPQPASGNAVQRPSPSVIRALRRSAA